MSDPTAGDDMCQLVNGAIEILNEDGWTQGVYKNNEGQYCLVGALSESLQRMQNKATLEAKEIDPNTWPILMERLRLDVPDTSGMKHNFWSLTMWNDVRGRTKEEVIALLETQC